MYPDNDYVSGIDGEDFDTLGVGGFPASIARTITGMQRRRYARRMKGKRHVIVAHHLPGAPGSVVWRSKGPRALSGEDTSYALSTPKGTIALTPEGISFVKPSSPAPIAPPSPGPGAGIMEWVQKNPLILAGGALVLVMLLRRRKK